LMDRMMPSMDGEQAIRRIREKYTKEELPIFAFTAADAEEDRNALLSAGANSIMLKPIVYENMLENLCQIIGLEK
jgi:DNA-binding response OmpR family regulator